MRAEVDYVIFKADTVECIWIGVTLIALIVNLLLLDVAVRNSRALKKLHVNGVRRYAANTQTYREILRIIKQAALFAVGVRAAMTPNYNVQKSWDYYFFIVCFLIAAVGMAISAILDWYRYRVLIDQAEARGLVEDVDAIKAERKSRLSR